MSYKSELQNNNADLQAILESVNELPEEVTNAVLYTEQTLTPEQQAQARANIGAASMDNVGANSDLDTFIANTDIDHAYDEATGAYYTVIRVYRDKLDGAKQYPFVYAPNGANAGIKSTYDIAIEEGWLLAINSGVFDTSTRKPDGIVIQNGTVVQNSPTATHAECKPLTIDESGNLGYSDYDADADTLIENGIVSAVCGFMPIVVDYEAVPETEWNAVSHYTQNAQRQIIGQWGNGDYAIVTCEGRNYHGSDGWTIAEAQTICKKLGLKFAYNLDGGGSTETMVGKKHVNTIYENTTGRIVPTFIVFNGCATFDKNAPEQESEYTFLNCISVPAGARINTGIPETVGTVSAEYKARNINLLENPNSTVSRRGHILSSANNYISFIKMHPNAMSNSTYLDANVLITKIGGTEHSIDDSIVNIDENVPHIIKMDNNGQNALVYLDGELMYTASVGNTNASNHMLHLFCYGGSPTMKEYAFEGEFYYLRLWDSNDNLIRNYRAARRNSDGVYGVYDEVQHIFYASESDTAFTA